MTEAVMILLLIFGFVLVAMWIASWLVLSFVHGGRRARSSSADESQMLQELYHGLSRMEERVESLETLLLDRERERERL